MYDRCLIPSSVTFMRRIWLSRDQVKLSRRTKQNIYEIRDNKEVYGDLSVVTEKRLDSCLVTEISVSKAERILTIQADEDPTGDFPRGNQHELDK